jgi:Trk-type K+ transport system membrane component
MLGIWGEYNETFRSLLKERNVDGWWFALFAVASSFCNAGFALFQDNMIPVVTDYYVLTIVAFLIAAGNTLYPVFFRPVFWVQSKLFTGLNRVAAQMILEEPKTFFTHLFTFYNTLWLLSTWLFITIVEYLLFFVEWDKVLAPFTTGQKLFVMFFQTIAVRTAGFNNVNVGDLSTGHLGLYVFTMYVSAYPLIISIRARNSAKSGLNQAKSVLGRDLIWLYLALIVICYIEEDGSFALVTQPYLRTAFEISSSFGTVGLSMGAPFIVVSFSGLWHVTSKLILMCVMLGGRHRGLPLAIDPTINFHKNIAREKLLLKALPHIPKSASDIDVKALVHALNHTEELEEIQKSKVIV